MPHTDTPSGRTESGIVDSKDRLQAETFILAEEEIFVVVLLHRIENKAFHSREFILRLLNRCVTVYTEQLSLEDHRGEHPAIHRHARPNTREEPRNSGV